MPNALHEKRWALLPYTDLPDASMNETLLGAIVPDFQEPHRNFIAAPKDSVTVVPLGNDVAFNTFVEASSDGKVWSRVGNLFKASFGEDSTTRERRKSQKVRSYVLLSDETTFDASLQANQTKILDMARNNGRGHNGAVYMVVGIKTCVDGQLWSNSSTSSHQEGEVEIPADAIVIGLTGANPPFDANVNMGFDKDLNQGRKGYLVAEGERIFAVKYRMIKTKADWRLTPAPRSKAKLNLGGYYKSKNNLAFGGDDVEARKNGEENDSVSDDTLVLGDELYGWSIESGGKDSEILFVDMK